MDQSEWRSGGRLASRVRKLARDGTITTLAEVKENLPGAR
jgi:hypothetical protein